MTNNFDDGNAPWSWQKILNDMYRANPPSPPLNGSVMGTPLPPPPLNGSVMGRPPYIPPPLYNNVYQDAASQNQFVFKDPPIRLRRGMFEKKKEPDELMDLMDLYIQNGLGYDGGEALNNYVMKMRAQKAQAQSNLSTSLRPITDEEHWNFINGRYVKQLRKIENPKGDPNLKNPTPGSTAKGLYQMTDSYFKDGKSFLKTNKLFSPITGDEWSVENQNKIFHSKLIKDAAELQKALGRKPKDWELYASHFLGVGGFKEKFLAEFEKNPKAGIMSDSKLLPALNNNPKVKKDLEDRKAMTYQGFADYYKEMFGEGTTWDVLNSKKPKESRAKDDDFR